MKANTKDRIRRLIIARLDEIANAAPKNDEQAPVVLDQTSVGRLSRMDAMQRQAMAQETARRRKAELTKLRAALARIDDEEFGFCVECGEEIPVRRIEIDPSASVCVACASGT